MALRFIQALKQLALRYSKYLAQKEGAGKTAPSFLYNMHYKLPPHEQIIYHTEILSITQQ